MSETRESNATTGWTPYAYDGRVIHLRPTDLGHFEAADTPDIHAAEAEWVRTGWTCDNDFVSWQMRPAPAPDGFDPVNKPRHYNSHPSGIEAIEITGHMDFCLGNAAKYVWRADHKGGLQDLEKARWYVARAGAIWGDHGRPAPLTPPTTPVEMLKRWAAAEPSLWRRELVQRLWDATWAPDQLTATVKLAEALRDLELYITETRAGRAVP